MKIKTAMLCSVALTLGACSGSSSIEGLSGPRYTPRAEIYQNNYTAENRMEDRSDTETYNTYEEREPCQLYRKPPRNYSDNCVSNMMETEVVMAKEKPSASLPIVRSYTVLFDFDKSDLRANEDKTLDRAMNEISKYAPKQVTVTGYTDSHGDAVYNQTLSRQREQTVSAALQKRGIQNQTLEHEARGEYDQAVQTADGVKNQENRRVVIDFRR